MYNWYVIWLNRIASHSVQKILTADLLMYNFVDVWTKFTYIESYTKNETLKCKT